MGYMSYSVREYIPPPLRCFNCQRYGHAASQFRGKTRCAKCGGEHVYGKCEQDAVFKCCNCGGNHSAAYGGCEKHKEAKDVQKCKIIYKVSYAEAVKKIEMEKKGSSLIVPPYTLEQSRETNTSNPISRVNYRIHPNERVQQVSRPRLNSQPSECCELKKKMSEETLLVKKNDFLAFICVVISKATELPQGSNKVKAIVDIANDFLGFRSQASKIQEILNSKYEGQNSD